MVGLGRCQEVLYFDLSKEIIHVPTLQGFIVWIPHPPESTSLHSCFPLKRLAFESSLPLEISSNPWGVGMKIFWNHTIVEDVFLLFLDMSTMEDAGKISNRCMWKKKLDSNPTQFLPILHHGLQHMWWSFRQQHAITRSYNVTFYSRSRVSRRRKHKNQRLKNYFDSYWKHWHTGNPFDNQYKYFFTHSQSKQMINLAMGSKITFTARAVIHQRLLTSATREAQMISSPLISPHLNYRA